MLYSIVAFASTLTPRVALVACCTGSSLQGLGVAIAAGCAAVVDSSPAFIGNARVRTVVRGEPVVGRMATFTIQTKHAGMEDRIAVAARTVGG